MTDVLALSRRNHLNLNKNGAITGAHLCVRVNKIFASNEHWFCHPSQTDGVEF